MLEQLREYGLTAQAHALLDERLSDLSRRSVALLGASGDLHALLNERQQTAGVTDIQADVVKR